MKFYRLVKPTNRIMLFAHVDDCPDNNVMKIFKIVKHSSNNLVTSFLCSVFRVMLLLGITCGLLLYLVVELLQYFTNLLHIGRDIWSVRIPGL